MDLLLRWWHLYALISFLCHSTEPKGSHRRHVNAMMLACCSADVYCQSIADEGL